MASTRQNKGKSGKYPPNPPPVISDQDPEFVPEHTRTPPPPDGIKPVHNVSANAARLDNPNRYDRLFKCGHCGITPIDKLGDICQTCLDNGVPRYRDHAPMMQHMSGLTISETAQNMLDVLNFQIGSFKNMQLTEPKNFRDCNNAINMCAKSLASLMKEIRAMQEYEETKGEELAPDEQVNASIHWFLGLPDHLKQVFVEGINHRIVSYRGLKKAMVTKDKKTGDDDDNG
jgi:hypothetical protein